ncbi:MAG: protein phosphatase CheZ [Ignavibacteriaceae bacterium]|nr:protein phosphatase CheZ [Ignavibacteriaceae bacterium]
MSETKQASNLLELFDKLNDLKSVFKYGEKLIPIVQSLIDFMNETVPLLENINTSITDSTSKIPKAAHQINDVTAATELATTEILDIVDMINIDIDTIEKDLKSITEKEKQKLDIILKLQNAVKDNSIALSLLQKYEELNSEYKNITTVLTALQKIKNNSYHITLSLQVQDITSQQLSAVNHLISGVQDKLATLLVDFQDTKTEEFEDRKIAAPQDAAFNPNAQYGKSGARQELANELVKSNSNNGSRTTQDEIDKIFS